MLNSEMIMKVLLGFAQKIIIYRLAINDYMSSQRNFGCAQRPDMQIMNATGMFKTVQALSDAFNIYALWHCINRIVDKLTK